MSEEVQFGITFSGDAEVVKGPGEEPTEVVEATETEEKAE